jgi:hypothetical protein
MLSKFFYNNKIRTFVMISLVFSFLFSGCSENNKKDELVISIQWEDYKATAIRIPYALLQGISFDSARRSVKVQLEDTGTDVLGEYSSVDGALIFRPLIPFTAGLTYKVTASGTPITRLSVPQTNMALMSGVVSVYPTGKDIPENLLKMYIRFSRPMQEGQALENIFMIRNEKDTVPVFLDLQQELWNKERTILTLWLDPGRIKRGLQPNERSGNPLQQGQHYRLVVKKKWRNTEGLELENGYNKEFTVLARDSISPSIDHWEIETPRAGSVMPLRIKLHEQLDYLLLKNAIRIVDGNNNTIAGIIETQANETELFFIPDLPWIKGIYKVEVESRLEDLAGNNLERLFDKDLTQQSTGRPKEIFKRSFHIQ